MTDITPPGQQSTDHPFTTENTKGLTDRAKIPPLRVTWIGIGIASLLWFGSTAYFQKTHRFSEIEYQAGNMSEANYSALTLRQARYSMACKLGAGVLLLASLLYLVTRTDIRKKP